MEMEVAELQGGINCVRLDGRLDAAGADQIGVRFTAAAVGPGQPTLVDLSGVSFVASLGLRLLISCAKGLRSKGAGLVVFGAQPAVTEVLDQVALDQIVPIAATERDAIARLQS
jgi:anti-anti-sigma factor